MKRDEKYMSRCISLAKLGQDTVQANPMVGAVLVKDDVIIGEGYHRRFGGNHAEVEAFNAVKNKSKIAGSTLYVSLEPCSHFGKTPPCCVAISDHKVGKVVIGSHDPNPLVQGRGIKYLKKNSIEVVEGVLKTQCQELNKRFFTFHQKKRPYIILKWAETADGFIDKPRANNASIQNQISGFEASFISQKLRKTEMAILVGKNTVLNDNPKLTLRKFSGKNPTRIILDSHLKIPSDLFVFSPEAKTIVISKKQRTSVDSVKYCQAETLSVQEILNILYSEKITSVIVEGGASVLQSFIDANIWDEALKIQSKKIMFGGGIEAPKHSQNFFLKEKKILETDIVSHFVNFDTKHIGNGG